MPSDEKQSLSGESNLSQKPRLRPLDFQPVIYQDQQMWLLRDPLELSEHQIILTPALAQILIYFDGSREVGEIEAELLALYGPDIDPDLVRTTLNQLDEACLLDNERTQGIIGEQLLTYRSQPYRPPTLLGLGYPADADELANAFIAYGRGDNLDGWQPWTGRGIISPHIDYQRGGPIYAQVWRRAEAAVKQADLVLIFGTDHNGGAGNITLTQIPYATPLGVLPTDIQLVDKLAEAIGPSAYDEELHHCREHSIELSAVWLHHIRGSNPPPVVPILCGSFHEFVMNGHHPDQDPRINAFIETLQAATAGKKVLAVASVDLAHVGPSFGDDFIMDADRRAKLVSSDKSLMEAIGQGDADRFYREVARVGDKNRICGFSSIYLMLRYLGLGQGIKIAYEQCPADQQNASLVSICSMLID